MCTNQGRKKRAEERTAAAKARTEKASQEFVVTPTATPVPTPTYQAPVERPRGPTPGPVDTERQRETAKVRPRRRDRARRSRGTSLLQVKRPVGLRGINTKQGVNTGTTTPARASTPTTKPKNTN